MRVYVVTRGFPREELFGLTSQLRRAALSSAANIVEGAARDGEKEYLHFLNQAMGSLREAGYLVDVAERLRYLPDDAGPELQELYDRAARTLSRLMQSLRDHA